MKKLLIFLFILSGCGYLKDAKDLRTIRLSQRLSDCSGAIVKYNPDVFTNEMLEKLEFIVQVCEANQFLNSFVGMEKKK